MALRHLVIASLLLLVFLAGCTEEEMAEVVLQITCGDMECGAWEADIYPDTGRIRCPQDCGSCLDGDGVNYFTAGIANDITGTIITDSCERVTDPDTGITEHVLTEGLCHNNTAYSFRTMCPGGCNFEGDACSCLVGEPCDAVPDGGYCFAPGVGAPMDQTKNTFGIAGGTVCTPETGNEELYECAADNGAVRLKLVGDCAKCGGVCSNGGCSAPQCKASAKYPERSAFLISDADWGAVLGLVPLSTWTDSAGAVQKHPVLIYHEEPGAFDADSIIHFLQQYGPEHVTIIGDTPQELDSLLVSAPELGAGMRAGQVRRITPEDYPSYWAGWERAVYSQNDYETALLASTYASLINAPLILEGSALDTAGALNGKDAVLVGTVACPAGARCTESYTIGQLERKYLELTNTDKVVLANPGDLGIVVDECLMPERSANAVCELYGKASLAAPLLASAKHQLLLTTTESGWQQVDAFIEGKIDALGMDAAYLTILASPDAIDMYAYDPAYGQNFEADFREYGDLDSAADNQSELAVGRIMGITTSDTSGLVARTLFYDLIKHATAAGLMVMRGDPPFQEVSASACGTGFCTCYFDVPCQQLADRYSAYFSEFDVCDETLCSDIEYGIFVHNLSAPPADAETRAGGRIMELSSPAIQGSRIVYPDYRDGSHNIYLYDLDAGTEAQITNDQAVQGEAVVYSDTVVWTDERHGNKDIYMCEYDAATGACPETRITTEHARQTKPAVYGNLVVWADERHGNKDIYMCEYDAATGACPEFRITADAANQDEPAVYGSVVVWADERHGNKDIYMCEYDAATGACPETMITSEHARQEKPAIHGNTVVWQDLRNGAPDIYSYDLASSAETMVTDGTWFQVEPAVYGDAVVWMDNRSGAWEIYMRYLSTGEERKLASGIERNARIAISEDRVAYMINLVPCPIECDERKEELAGRFHSASLSVYADHGLELGWSIVNAYDIGDVPPEIAYSFACSTCNYSSEKANLFCAHAIRKGAVAYIGAVQKMYGHHFLDEWLEETLVNKKSIGEAFKAGKNKEALGHDGGGWATPTAVPTVFLGAYDVLIGDPTFEPDLGVGG